MPSLACVAAEFNQWTGSAFLVAFQRHAAARAYFEPIERHLQVGMKRVRYSPLQKVQTLVASIVLGCPHTKAINHELVPDRVAAQEWGMERFPDQSQINLLLNRLTEENVVTAQLGQAHHELLLAHSQLRSEPVVVVDLDQTGLTVTDYYNQRQTIEAFFKAGKHVFGMANLRSRLFLSIAAFLRFVMITHNLLVWTKAALFAGTRLATARTRKLVEQVARIPAVVVRRGASLYLPDVGTLARHLREALCPVAVQLPLPNLRL